MVLYVILGLLGLWAVAMQCDCFPMRRSDQSWGKYLKEKGQSLLPQFVKAPDGNGRQVHTVALGDSTHLPLVVLVHGSPGASDAFIDYFADTSFTQVVRLISIDRPGFGYTEFGVPEPSLKAQAEAILTILRSLAPDQRALLVGHSLGGPVIARFAMEYPELTQGLVIVAGSIDPEQEAQPWWQAVVNAPPVKWLVPKVMWTSNAEIIPLKKELEKMKAFWSKIKCPVSIVHATDDRLVPVANAWFGEKMLVNSPKVQLNILPKGDHFILWSEQDLIKSTILGMLGR